MTNKPKKNIPTTSSNKAVNKVLAEEERRKIVNENNLIHLTHLQALKRPNLADSKDVEQALINYFGLCHADNVMPTTSGLALSLGMTRDMFLKVVNGQIKTENRDIVVKYFGLLEVYDEIAMKRGEIPSLVAIFNAKNNYGYKDRIEIGNTEEDLSDEEIERRYREKHEVVSEQ